MDIKMWHYFLFFLKMNAIIHVFSRYKIVANSISTIIYGVGRRLKAVLMTIAVLSAQEVMAQYDVVFSHYYDMEPSFNPAAVGKDKKLNIRAAYAMDLAGFEHNPQTAYLGADMPFRFLNATHGAGIQFVNDKLGLFNHTRLSLQYANKQRLFGGTLSVGLQLAMLAESFDGSDLDLEESSDPAFSSSHINGNAFDISAGLYYTWKDLYVGLSAKHLTAPKVELGELNELKVSAAYYATAGYTINLRNPMMTVKTSALARTDGVMTRADFTARLIYTTEKKRFYGGLSYSPTNSVTALLGMDIQGIHVGYSYECYTSGLNPGNGSHELFVAYQMDLNIVKKGKNLHKSVRFL